MKITCESCQAKYTIADEKVVGKIVKIKCKKCGTTIVVNGNEAGAQASASAPPVSVGTPHTPGAHSAPPHAHGGDEDAATRVFGNQGMAGGDQLDEWTVNVTDDDQRTMAAAQVAQEYANGLINGDTYVWRDGMPDWLPLCEVSELMALINATPSQRPQAQAMTPTPLGLGGPVPMGHAPAAAASPFGAGRLATPSPSAARRAGGRAGGIDVFGAAAQQQEAPKSSRPPPAEDRAIGERNENSVLFSLSALTAAENAAKAQTSTRRSDDASLDFRPSPMSGGRSNNGRAGLDDIMNLGGGGLGGMLAPPPLMAPVVEPPPPPPPPPSVQTYQPAASPMLMATPPQQKSKTPLIIGAVAGLAVIGGLVFALSSSSSSDVPTTPEQAAASTPVAAPTPTETAAPAPTETTAAAEPTATATSAAAPVKPGAAPPGGKTPEPKATAAAAADTKPAETPKAEAPKPAETSAPASADGAKEFNRGAASAALGAAAGAAKSCKKGDGPTGSGKVKVTFAPSGNVTSAAVVGAPFAGTPTGGCIASAFRSAKVPPFDGSPVSVTKSFSIN